MKPVHIILLLLIIAGFVINLNLSQNFTFDLFFERDYVRAIKINNDFFRFGPEIYGGGRTPGFLYNLQIYIMNFVSNSNIYIFYALYLLSILLGCYFLQKTLPSKNLTQVLIFYAIFFSSYFVLEIKISMWNPTLSFLFLCVYFYSINEYIKTKRDKFLYLSFVCMGFCSHAHLSAYFLYLMSFIVICFKRPGVSLKTITYCLLILIVPLVPYIIYEINNFHSELDFNGLKNVTTGNFLGLNLFFKTVKVYLNHFGFIYPNGDFGLQWAYRSNFHELESGDLIKCFVSITSGLFLFVLGISSIFYNKSIYFIKEKQNNITLLFLVALILTPLVDIFSFNNHSLHLRRYIWIFPITILFLSNTFYILYEKVSKPKRKVLILIFVIYFFSNNFYKIYNPNYIMSPESFVLKESIINTLTNDFEMSKSEIVNRVGVVAKGSFDPAYDDGYALRSYLGDHSSLLIESNLGDEYWPKGDSCILVVVKYENILSQKLNTKDLPNIKSIKGLETLEVLSHFETDRAHYFKYNMFENNCLTVFKNFYFSNRLELNQSSQNLLISSLSIDEDYYLFSVSSNKGRYGKFLKVFFSADLYISTIPFSRNINTDIRLKSKEKSYTKKLFPRLIENKDILLPPVFIDITDVEAGEYDIEIDINLSDDREQEVMKFDHKLIIQ